MKPRILVQSSTLRVLQAMCILATPCVLLSQTQLDISSCFNPLLQQRLDYSSDERLALAKLAQVSESDYEASKHDVTLAGKFKVLAASIDYKDFDDKRREYFSVNKLEINQYRSISLSSRTLDSKAYDLIKDCIGRVAAQQYGFHYLYTIDDPGTTSLQLFWYPTEGGGPIAVLDSYLENAVLKSQSVPPQKLFPYVNRWSLTPYPKIQGASAVLLLQRTDLTKNIRISLQTRPQVNTPPITIQPVPQPVKDIKCETVYDTRDPITGKDYRRKEQFDLTAHMTDAHGCSDCHGYSIGYDAPGPVTSVACEPSGDHVWQEICDSEGKHIRAIGYENANPRSLYITFAYKVARNACEFPR